MKNHHLFWNQSITNNYLKNYGNLSSISTNIIYVKIILKFYNCCFFCKIWSRTIYSVFWCDPVKSIYDHNFEGANKGYLLQKHTQILWQWTNFWAKYQYLITQTDAQTNFKLSHGNIINSRITMKTRPFQPKKNYGNQNTHSKVMSEKRFKKDFHVTLYKVSITRSQFLVHERRLFASKIYPRSVILNQFLRDL